MSGHQVVAAAAAALCAAGSVLFGVARAVRWRVRRRLVGMTRAAVPRPSGDDPPFGTATAHPPSGERPRATGAQPSHDDRRRLRDSAAAWLAGPRRWCVVAAVAAGALAAGGPVAALAAAGYGSAALTALDRRRRAATTRVDRRAALDRLCAVAAALRAGQPPAALLGTPTDLPGTDQLRVAVRLAERTGAPLVELVERVEADLRATERLRASTAAQAAGARATALLLAALPLGGIALGYGVGVDPAAILLHTPLGAVCAVLSMVLQLLGLMWSQRIADAAAPA
ncbi:hypothetical protein GCM10010123_27030 [Pilimelia anulata]|uniref:Tight adherence protein B n=1 Tax=Pilimelia anulata TaxID=53371 RepID=A0A8J3B9S5_9ACTN|nr:hypothetical protein [Pilimelia anulata]GGJ95725.1 hypothetical protein GCM10010123_27030 [Pilimelia anulata]